MTRSLVVFSLLLGWLWLAETTALAQTTSEEDAVIAAVQQLFDAIATRDTVAAEAVLLPEGQFYSVREENGQPVVRNSPHSEFLTQLGGEGADWLERLWEPTVLIQGPMAMVWTPYDFHVDGTFSHCGVDAFSLFKTAEGWKIAGTTYTVERTDCPESPLGSPK